MLSESVHSDLKIVSPEVFVQSRLQAAVIGRLIGGGDDGIIGCAALVVGAVVVIKGRNRQQRIGIEGVDPGEGDVAIALMLAITKAVTGGLPRPAANC